MSDAACSWAFGAKAVAAFDHRYVRPVALSTRSAVTVDPEAMESTSAVVTGSIWIPVPPMSSQAPSMLIHWS